MHCDVRSTCVAERDRLASSGVELVTFPFRHNSATHLIIGAATSMMTCSRGRFIRKAARDSNPIAHAHLHKTYRIKVAACVNITAPPYRGKHARKAVRRKNSIVLPGESFEPEEGAMSRSQTSTCFQSYQSTCSLSPLLCRLFASGATTPSDATLQVHHAQYRFSCEL